ncbi:hypothetical protein [Chitinophaga cymbidii]|uniref:Uncharacterized protein n=1 Tax=Chitinophaga cymbidii TaxID=1096750 RepID=A0A512RN22_9BACT|nr:hypothetical protein [Chitinophaga cymbidii]GEP97105.1 hypothetical protein CCY01nite_33650 [Chitinophaga cymbidii]
MEELYAGKWTGQYTYGDEYAEELRGLSVPFIIDIQVDDDGELEGMCMDMDEEQLEAVVKGYIEDGYISFIKKYMETDPGGEPVFMDIHYYGEYRDGAFAGEWEIEWSVINEAGSRVEYLSTGIWEMRRL